MLQRNTANIVRSGALALPILFAPLSATATDFRASRVLNDMSTVERAAYLAGVVEGFAYARYTKDGKQADGMTCIYDWFYQNDETPQAILTVFKRFPDYTPGAIIAAMLEKECGT